MALAKVTMTGATKNTVKQGFTAVNQLIDDLASNENLKGASCVGIEDAAGNMAATNVEDAFAEVYDDMGTIQATSNTFSEDAATTTGLTWGYKGGLLRNTTEVVTIADGTVSLTDDTTNYIEIASDGTVYVVASAFTAGRIPIRTVVTASGVQGTSTDKRAWFATLSDLVSNTAWGPSWDSVTTIAPSKNSVYNWGIVDHNTDGTHEKLTLGSDADGDMYYRASSALVRLAKGAANQILRMNSGATAPEWATARLPLGYITGLTIAHAADTEHDITVAAGEARDDTDADDMVLASAITKQADAAWSVGTDAGGMAPNETIVMELMTLDVAPGGAGWAKGDTITGVSSGKTCKILTVLTTKTYLVKDRDGAFTLGEIMTNGTDTADQGAANPTFATTVGTLHIWLIKRSDTGVVDVMFSNHADTGLSPALPADYDYKRRIFSLRTDASNNIINGDQWGTGLVRAWMYDSPTLDISDAATGTNAKTVALPVPQGIVTKVLVNAQSSTANAHYLSATFNADMDTGAFNASANAPLASLGTTHTVISSQIHIFADTSATIRYRSDVNGTLRVSTIGWEDSL